MKSFALLSLVSTLLLHSINGFQATSAVKQVKSLGGRIAPTNDDVREGHFRRVSTTELIHQNAFSKSNPSITSYYWTSPGPSRASDTSLASFQSRSFFRSSEIASAESSSSRASRSESSSPITATRSSRVKTLIIGAPQSAYQSLAALQLPSVQLPSIQLPRSATRTFKKYVSRPITSLPLSEAKDQVAQFVLNYWWMMPTFLALVPLYTTFVLGAGDPAMPHWWPVTHMDHIVKAPDAAMVIGCFLLSNIAYFASGIFLLKKFPFVRPTSATAAVSTIRSTTGVSTVSAMALTLRRKVQEWKMVPTQQTWLGLFMIISGLISTVFHTEQALGSYAIANSLCYLDHAVAGTSTFYWFHTCDLPSKRVWLLGIVALAALSIPHPAYAWLHSSWHFLSAGAATLWALESFDETFGAARRPTSTAEPMVAAVVIPSSDPKEAESL